MPGSARNVRGDTWELRAFLGRDVDGKVRHRYETVHGTKKEADNALVRLLVRVEDERSMAPMSTQGRWGPKTTINDALEGWRDNGWDDLSPSTVRRYKSIWKVHIHDTIGQKAVATLSPYDVEQFFRTLKSQGLAQATVRQARAMLHRACRLARRWSGNVLPNPIADTELPSWSLGESTAVRAPEVSEVLALLRAAAGIDSRFASFLRTIVATGIRRGEACALRWSDIDLAKRTVRIQGSVVAADGGAVIKSPKTRASIRVVAVDGDTVASLKSLQGEQAALAAACEVPLHPDGFAFSAEPGGLVPPHPDTMSHVFAQVRTKARVAEDLHLHSLRYFQSTVLDSVISESQKQVRLGWATVHMARHYTDAVPAEDRRAADHVGRLLTPKKPRAKPGGASTVA
jgi:integrase